MPVGVMERRSARIVLGIVGAVLALLVLAQLLLPTVAAKRVRSRVAHFGTVKSVSVHAWPAVELLWGKADSVSVNAGTLSATSDEISSLLWEAHNVSRVTIAADAATVHVASLPSGLTVDGIRMEKHGAAIAADATLTQQQLDEALPNGFHVEPVASEDGQVEAKVSGGLFGLHTSINALVKPFEGRLVAEPQGFPLAGLATVTLFSDSHLKVESVAVRVSSSQPLTYGLSLRASLV